EHRAKGLEDQSPARADLQRHEAAQPALVDAREALEHAHQPRREAAGEEVPREHGPVTVQVALQSHLNRHRAMFSGDLFTSGLTARLMRVLQRLAGVDERWLRSLMTLEVGARRRLVLETFRPVL